jgi:hypothetical protein
MEKMSLDNQHKPDPKQEERIGPLASPAPASQMPAATVHEITIRLAANASAKDLAQWMKLHLHGDALWQARSWLQQHKSAKVTDAFLTSLDAAIAKAPDKALSGSMLVSNNPEGLTSSGKIMSTQVSEGKLAAFIHHSNHTSAPMNLFLAFRPTEKSSYVISGAGVSKTTLPSAPNGKSVQNFEYDPNVAVADAVQGSGGGKVALSGDSANVLSLGTLRGKKAKETTEPLLDARYDLNVTVTKAGVDVDDQENVNTLTAEVIAVPAAAIATNGQSPVSAADKAAALSTTAMAKGNTKYQSATSNGRASGVYEGANMHSDQTVNVTAMKPFRQVITGGRGSDAPTPQLTQAAEVAEVKAADVAKTMAIAGGNADRATVAILDKYLRISAEWLAELGVWKSGFKEFIFQPNDPKTNKPKVDKEGNPVFPLSSDYMEILLNVKKSLLDISGQATADYINKVSTRVSANGDFASYGTVIELAYLLNNDTDAAANMQVNFVSDVAQYDKEIKQGIEPPNKAGTTYRGNVIVDGKPHTIESDDAKGRSSQTKLDDKNLAAGQSQYMHIKYMSPGQISAGQAIEIAGQGGKPVTETPEPIKTPDPDPTKLVEA